MLENQRYGRNKGTVVNHTYIESGVYRNKFDKITHNKNMSRILYSKAKEMLEHRSGTLFEDMYWIDGITGMVVERALNEQSSSTVVYSDAINKAIQGNLNLIAMHTHPHSMPPSIADFNSAFIHGYMISLVLCHDGKVFQYSSHEEIRETLYDLYIMEFLDKGYSEYEAQIQTLESLKKNYDIDFWEVE